jgi:hypothetical protein
MKSAAFFAYADNYLTDVKFGIIMDVEASRAIRQRSARHGRCAAKFRSILAIAGSAASALRARSRITPSFRVPATSVCLYVVAA